MFCAAYNQSLTDAAASSEALSPALQQHLASCESCRATFAEEQSLYVAIDSGLHRVANTDVPATLTLRVHVALNSQPASQSRSPKWLFAGATLAATLVIVFVLRFNRREPSSQKNMAAQSPASVSVRSPEAPPHDVAALHPAPQRPTRVETVKQVSAQPETLLNAEILVPDEERIAFAKFLARNQSTPPTISAAASLVPQAPRVLVPLQPVEIASLRVPSLNGEEASRDEFKELPSRNPPSRR